MADEFDAVQILEKILAEHGPVPEDDLLQRMRDAGMPELEFSFEHYVDELDCPAGKLVDDRWVWLPTLLAGRVFTHRLEADEIVHDILTAVPNLTPITTLCMHEQYGRFIDGSPAQVAFPDFDHDLLEERGIPEEVVDGDGALVLVRGTLAGLSAAASDLVGVRLTASGIEVEKVAPSEHGGVGARLAAALHADRPTSFDEAAWTVCAEDPAVFTEPIAPLSDIAEDFGLPRRHGYLAPAGFDFDTWYFERGCEMLAQRHEIDAEDASALYMLISLFEQVAQVVEALDLPMGALAPPTENATGAGANRPELDGFDEFIDDIGELGGALADPLLTELLAVETIGAGSDGAVALSMFAELLEPKVPRAARVACRWLRSVALERIGDIDAWELELLAAESMDPDWPLPLLDLARLASDRGDAERGLALLRRGDAAPDNPLLQLLEQHRAAPRGDIGRNALCWCGSGRKYKKCHLGREQLPLSDRARWLYAKASQHTLHSGWDDELATVAYERARHTDDDYSDALTSALDDPLVMDSVLFEGGAFEEFLEIRGALLPDDERLLAEQWLLVERSVFEIEQVRRGQGMVVRDLRTGDTHEVRERTASGQLKPGQLVCARVVPAGDTMQIFGGLEPVALHERDLLIELLDEGPEASTLVAALSRRFAPPEVVNTEGEPLALCEATVRISDPASITAALDDTYDRIGGQEPRQWIEQVNTHGTLHVRATLVLDIDTLRVEANSHPRMNRVLASLVRLDPTVYVLDDSRRPLGDALEATELAEPSPETAALLDEHIRDYEVNWLDQPLPALQGHTPREAADDPTRRGDLIKLLDSFPKVRPGTMDVDRLRAALGLR